MNRWCIIGSLRSGSTSLQHKIFLKLPKVAVTLGEYTHPQQQVYQDSSGTFFQKQNNFYSDERIKFRHTMQQLIETTDTSVVMKVFPQPWVLPNFDYINFFKILKDNNFKFIRIHRDLFSRAMSLAMAQTTELWHRQYTAQGLENLGNTIIQASVNNKIKLDPETFKECIDLIVKHDTALYNVMPLDTTIINYQTMNIDCKNAGIPIVTNGPHIKTYNDSYTDIIENYNEIKNMKDWATYG
jgi:hypothetical protein